MSEPCGNESIWVFKSNEGIVGDISNVGRYPQTKSDRERDRDVLRGGMPDAYELHPDAKWTDVISPSVAGPRGFFLINDRVRQLLESFDVGFVVSHPVTVTDQLTMSQIYHFVRFDNDVPASAIDFSQSEFYLANSAGFKIRDTSVDSLDEFDRKSKAADEGRFEVVDRFGGVEFSRLAISSTIRETNHLFTLRLLYESWTHVTADLAEALRDCGITGLELAINRRLLWCDF